MSTLASLSPTQRQQAMSEAVAEVLKTIVPQAFTNQNIIDMGESDEWKLSKISGRTLLSLIYFRHRGTNDNIRFYREMVDYFLRGSGSIEGWKMRTLENISIGLGSGGGRKRLMVKPSWVGRHITKRDWEKKADRENIQIIE